MCWVQGSDFFFLNRLHLLRRYRREPCGVSAARRLHPDSGVNYAAALPRRKGKDRIKIKLGDLRSLLYQPGDAEQHLLNGVDIRRPLAPVALQEAISPDFPDHLTGIPVGQRSYSKAHIAQNFDVDAAQAKSDERTEKGILRYALHSFEIALFGQPFANLFEGLSDGSLAGEIEPDATDLCLVDDAMRRQFHGHRKTDISGQTERLLGALRYSSLGKRQVQCVENHPGFLAGEPAGSAFPKRGSANLSGRLEIHVIKIRDHS